MYNVLILYGYETPLIPNHVEVALDGMFPKCNYRIVTQVTDKAEGERIGQEAFEAEVKALSWLINDSELHEIDLEYHSETKDLSRWYAQMEAEYKERKDRLREDYQQKRKARRAKLIAQHMRQSGDDK